MVLKGITLALTTVSLALGFAATPITFHANAGLQALTAAAKDGGGSGGGSSGSGSSGGGHGSGGSSGGSGSSGGRGSSGNGGGQSGGSSSGGSRSGSRGDDHGGQRGEGSSARGRGTDDNGNDDRRSGERRQSDDGRRGLEHVSERIRAKVEVNGRNIEVTTADGFKEEIENGRYEMKDRRGRTIVERAATAADRARLFGAAR